MRSARLSILCLSQMPPSPPRFGAQARMHGLWTALARQHDLTSVALADDGFDLEECRAAMGRYSQEVLLLPNPRGRGGAMKRALQLRSLASVHSFERHRVEVPALGRALDQLLRTRRFDVVNVEFPYLAHLRLRQAPPGTRPPAVVVDSHEIAHEMVRQFAAGRGSLGRTVYASLNWRKLRHEELAAYRSADGVAVCSEADRQRVLRDVPSARTVVVPNAADVDHYRPRSGDPSPDGRTVLFFGLLSTLPNIDGIRWFVREVWPRITAVRPDARLEILGKGAPREVEALAAPGIEVAGFVEDLRPHLAAAAAVVVPLRLGGGTRLKIVEAMAMARPIVSTRLGAEGIEAEPGRELLLADEPEAFAAAVLQLLQDPASGARLGSAARRLSEERYSWTGAATAMDGLFQQVLERRRT
ncbi:MAG TPA: glycosyltransferase family 4 protein [Myxococcaceae bacterium]|nr:glycosyltransferase family 4 protein [Myxococcaceae bacterium]